MAGIDRAAILLNALPAGEAEAVLTHLGPERGEQVRARMEALGRDGVKPEALAEVVRAFEQALEQGAGPAASEAPGPRLSAYRPAPDEAADGPSEEARLAEELIPGEDPTRALGRLPPEQLAGLLHGEQVHTVALVLNGLPPTRAGEVLRHLTPELRREVSVRLSRMGAANPQLLARIAQALLSKRRSVSAGSRAEPNAAARYEKMAEMLRVLDKAERLEVVAALEEKDPETAARVRDLLYQFEDLLRIHDRSLQKLLAEIDSKSLSVALKGATEAIRDKVLGNLSRRARETLAEEMEFLGMIPAAQVAQAQKTVVEVIQRLDQAGELVMDE